MDSFTLIVASALAGLTMAISMGLLYLASARRVCLRHWALAGSFFAASNVLAAAAIHFQFQHGLLTGSANALYVAGHYGILAGLRHHLGMRPRWDAMGVVAVLVLGAHCLPALQASVTLRMIAFTPVIVAIDLGAAWLLWRQRDREAQVAYWPLIVLELLFAAQLVARTVYLAVRDSVPLSFMGSHFLQTSGSLFVLVFLAMATMSCALIVTQQQAQALLTASLTDELTGWQNRRALHDVASRAFRRCRRTGAGTFFITFDIDLFKSINDRYGHAVGDSAIRHVTDLSSRILRDYDTMFRIGGEEFAVLITEGRLDDVCRVAERLRELVAASPLLADGHPEPVRMTVSVGVAALAPEDGKWEDMLRRADLALYHAKRHGRNRVSVHGVDLPAPYLIQTA